MVGEPAEILYMNLPPDISLVRRPDAAPKLRFRMEAERDMLAAITNALNQGYDGCRIVWDKKNPDKAVYVNPVREGKGVRCG